MAVLTTLTFAQSLKDLNAQCTQQNTSIQVNQLTVHLIHDQSTFIISDVACNPCLFNAAGAQEICLCQQECEEIPISVSFKYDTCLASCREAFGGYEYN